MPQNKRTIGELPVDDFLKNMDIIVKTTVRLETEEIIERKLSEILKNLPTKNEFFDKMDELMGELKDIREETDLLSGRVSIHSDQLADHDSRLLKIEHKKSG